MVLKMWVLVHVSDGALQKRVQQHVMVFCRGNNSASGLERVNIYCFFTGLFGTGAFDGIERSEIVPVVATLSLVGLKFLLTIKRSDY